MVPENQESKFRHGASAKSIPVVSDANRQHLVGVAYWSEGDDILIVVSDERYKKEVGAYFNVDGVSEFMLGCRYIPAKKYQTLSSTEMHVRKMLIDFSNNPRVLINSPENRHDGRKGRVRELNKKDAKIWVVFESGPGDVAGWFERHEVQIIRDDVDIRVVDC